MSNRLENNKVATRYARALFDSTAATGEVGQIAQDLASINSMIAQVPELNFFLENPGIPLDEKVQFVDKQFGKSVSPWVSRLLKLLVENNRMAIFPQLVTQFAACIHQQENTAQAEV